MYSYGPNLCAGFTDVTPMTVERIRQLISKPLSPETS